MIKRITTLVFALLTIVGNAMWGQTTVSISDAAGLKSFAERVNEGETTLNAVLTADIDLNGSEESQWIPIDDFEGIFDGKGHTISGVYIDNTSDTDDKSNTFGFFASTSGTIQNLNIEKASINVTIGDKTGVSCIGGVAGHVENSGAIINCSFDGEINVEASEVAISGAFVGGICGLYESKAIESCHNGGNIDVTIKKVSTTQITTFEVCVSGICNVDKVDLSSTTDIKNSYNTGSIKVEVNEYKSTQVLYSLGVYGIVNGIKCNIISCYNTGEINVSGKDNKCLLTIGSVNGSGAYSVSSCYNTGRIESTVELDNTDEASILMKGSISASASKKYNNNYYLPQDGLNAVGGNESYNDKDEEIEKATEVQFRRGEVAYLLREYGFGQNLQDENIASPTLLCFTPDDAVYKLTLDYSEYNDEEQIEKFVNSKYLGLPELTTEEEGKHAGWFDASGKEYTSESEITEDITLTAKVTEQSEEPEEPGDEDENKDDDDDQGSDIHKPQRPIKYYNIYVDTICPGLNVEVSKDVVQEGHQVSAYLTIQAECDTTGMRFEYKRGLFGYWKDLKELEGVQPGEYIIKNIYTDIYIRALDAPLPEEEPTGIEAIEGAKAYAKDGSIYVYTPSREEVMIIGMSGAIIKHEEQVGLQSYNVSRGIYIVRIGDKVFKLKN